MSKFFSTGKITRKIWLVAISHGCNSLLAAHHIERHGEAAHDGNKQTQVVKSWVLEHVLGEEHQGVQSLHDEQVPQGAVGVQLSQR